MINLTRGLQGLPELIKHLGIGPGAPAPAIASAIDFILEGLYAQKKISRSDERGMRAGNGRRPRAARTSPSRKRSGCRKQEELLQPGNCELVNQGIRESGNRH